MRAIDEARWLERAVVSCATSAVAYKAAFMLAGSTRDEREFLCRCTNRYGLLERLLGELQLAVSGTELHRLIEGLDSDPSRYADCAAALAAAAASDRDLQRARARRAVSAASVQMQHVVPARPLTAAGACA